MNTNQVQDFGIMSKVLTVGIIPEKVPDDGVLLKKPLGNISYSWDDNGMKKYGRTKEDITKSDLCWLPDKGNMLRDELFLKLIYKITEDTVVSVIADAFFYLGRLQLRPTIAILNPVRRDLFNKVASCNILPVTSIQDNMIYIFPSPQAVGHLLLDPNTRKYSVFVAGIDTVVRVNLSKIITNPNLSIVK